MSQREVAIADPPQVEVGVEAAEAQRVRAQAKEVQPLIDPDRLHRFAVGFLVAAAFFLIEAGVSEILLARNAACEQSLAVMRVAPNPDEACLSELGRSLAAAASRATFNPEASPAPVWLLLTVGYGVLGAGFAQLSRRWAVIGYLIVHVLLLIGFTSISYLSQFIV